MDVGKLGEQKLDEITNNAFHALTSVSTNTRFTYVSEHMYVYSIIMELHCKLSTSHIRTCIQDWTLRVLASESEL